MARACTSPAALAHHRGSATSREGSAFKYRLVGRNRMRLLAKNATAGQLARYGLAMVAFDLAYVAVRRRHGPHRRAAQGRWPGCAVARGPGRRARRPAVPRPWLRAGSGWSGALGQWRGYRRGGAR